MKLTSLEIFIKHISTNTKHWVLSSTFVSSRNIYLLFAPGSWLAFTLWLWPKEVNSEICVYRCCSQKHRVSCLYKDINKKTSHNKLKALKTKVLVLLKLNKKKIKLLINELISLGQLSSRIVVLPPFKSLKS